MNAKEYVEIKNTVLAMPYPDEPLYLDEIQDPVEYSWDNFWDQATPFALYKHKYGTATFTRHAFDVGKSMLLKNLEFKFLGKVKVPLEVKMTDTMPLRPKYGKRTVYFKYEDRVYSSSQLFTPLSTEFINRIKTCVPYSITVRDRPYVCFPMTTKIDKVIDCTHIEDISHILDDMGHMPAWLPEITFSAYDVNNFDHPLFETMRETGNYTLRNQRYDIIEDIEAIQYSIIT
jgi:hypothetical protein